MFVHTFVFFLGFKGLILAEIHRLNSKKTNNVQPFNNLFYDYTFKRLQKLRLYSFYLFNILFLILCLLYFDVYFFIISWTKAIWIKSINVYYVVELFLFSFPFLSSLWKLPNEEIKPSISIEGNGRFPIKYLMTYVSLLDIIYEQKLFQSFCIDSYVYTVHHLLKYI